MIVKSPEAGDVYILTLPKASELADNDPPVRVDVRVKSIDDDTVFCTIANRPSVVSIKREVFMKVVDPTSLVPHRPMIGDVRHLLEQLKGL